MNSQVPSIAHMVRAEHVDERVDAGHHADLGFAHRHVGRDARAQQALVLVIDRVRERSHRVDDHRPVEQRTHARVVGRRRHRQRVEVPGAVDLARLEPPAPVLAHEVIGPPHRGDHVGRSRAVFAVGNRRVTST